MWVLPVGPFQKADGCNICFRSHGTVDKGWDGWQGDIQVPKSISQSVAARQLLSCCCWETGSILSAGNLREDGGDGGGGLGVGPCLVIWLRTHVCAWVLDLACFSGLVCCNAAVRVCVFSDGGWGEGRHLSDFFLLHTRRNMWLFWPWAVWIN